MEQHREKPDSQVITKLVHDKALEHANRLFENAYEGQPFSRITVEDMDVLIADLVFYDTLLCVGGGGLGDSIKAELQQYNKDRQKVANDSLVTVRNLEKEDREALFEQIRELHHRPPKPQPAENPDMF
jgi:hypothetical protein